MANLYFDEGLGPVVPGDLVEVIGEEARHAVRVSRLRVGEQTLLGNGAGLLVEGVVERTDKDSFAVRAGSVNVVAAPAHRLVLVQALAKGDRDERAVEQATEFGVDAIVPWQSARSVSRWGSSGGNENAEKLSKGVAKWSRIAREAAKQSMRAWVPEVRDPVTLDELCAVAGAAHLVALHPRGAKKLTDWADSVREQALAGSLPDVFLVVGPEGGFIDTELDAIEAAGGTVLVLGSTVLRTSSAGPAALAVLNAAFGRW